MKYVASAGRDGTIRVWNADTGSMLGHPLRATAAVQAVVCWEKSDEIVLTSAGSDGSFSSWNPYDGTLIARTITDHGSGIRDIATWAAGGHQYLATGGYEGTIRIWDVESGLRIGRPFSAPGSPIAQLIAWRNSKGECRLASGDDNGIVRVWDLADWGSQIGGPLSGHAGAVGAFSLLNQGTSGELLVSGSIDGTIRAWDAEAGTCVLGPFQEDSTGIRSLCSWMNSDGHAELASGDLKGIIRVWDLVEGRPVDGPYSGSTSSVTALTCWSESNLISGGADGVIRIWDLATKEQVREIPTGHAAAVWALTAWQDSDGPRLAIAGADGLLRVCDANKGTIINQSASPHGPGVWAMTSWKDQAGERRIASGSLDGTICIWTADCKRLGQPFGGHSSSVSALAWWRAPNGDVRLASAGDDALIRLWDPGKGELTRDPLKGHRGGLLALTAWHDTSQGTRLASAGSGNTMRIWIPDTGLLAGGPLTALTQEFWALCSWHDAAGAPRLASGDFEGTVRIWDAATGAPIGQPLRGKVGTIRAFACWREPDGSTRIAAGGDGGVQIWNADIGASVRDWEVPGGVRALACWQAADGSVRLASGGDDGTVWLWDAFTGIALRTIEVGDVLIWGLSDTPAQTDVLGRQMLVQAIAAQLHPHDTSGPTVVTIEGPWGCGKTTLMDLVSKRLTQADDLTATTGRKDAMRLTVREATHDLRLSPRAGSAATASHQDTEINRRVLTAWFNPWAHQSGQQIWAGLASAIIEAAQPVLCPTEEERERYWFSRNLYRVDRHSLRRTLQRRILSPVLGIALLTVALPLAIALVESGKPVSILGHPVNAVTLALIVPIAVLITGSIHTFARYWNGYAVNYLPSEIFHGPISNVNVGASSGEPVGYADPLRHATRGSLYLHQHDVAAVLADIGEMGYDLVVFVDDLDRCNPSTTAEVFEAINLFLYSLNSDGLFARFVIGMDSAVIVAHLDQIYSGLYFGQVARQGEDPSAGWTYLRKLVQLPVIVPKVSEQALDNFINSISGASDDDDEGMDPQLGDGSNRAGPAQPQQSPASRTAVPEASLGLPSSPGIASWRPVPPQVIPWRAMERHPMVRELMRERLAAQPDRSIREAKRLLNVWQFYARILTQTQPLDSPSLEISRARTLVLLAEITVRWPALQRYLLQRVNGRSGLQALSEPANNEIAWKTALAQLGVDLDYHREALASLRLLLLEYEGDTIAHLAEELF